MNEHYFSAAPGGEERRRRIDVQIAGEAFKVDTAASIFSPDGLDRGTEVLLNNVPVPPQEGSFLDIGSGWGPIALTLGRLAPNADVLAVEVNERAAELTARNAEHLGLSNIEVRHPDEVTEDIRFDLIWSNPPIRIGKKALHELLIRWLPMLNPGGAAWLVVAKKLGADSLLPWIDAMLEQKMPGQFNVRRTATDKGFRVLHIERVL
ncbi:class I SAM-dependent methyltransferase [Yaniella halotolerans]|uniref:class I SAM-dependent methyltransferase n=1 Tax=Yaniella halotolerans TaxID=225453 RepID=UPI0003B4FA88|nr:methyltransferase [Yaniella halotolerans]